MKLAFRPALLALAFIVGVAPLEAAPRYISSFGSQGTGPGQFNRPYGLDAAPNGTIFVSDSANHRISYFKGDGRFVGSFGGLGTGPGKFTVPLFVSISPNGKRVLVGDYRNERVQMFSRTGSFLRLIFVGGNPTGVRQWPGGRIHVGDDTNDRVAVFAAGGSLLDSHDAAASLETPAGIAMFPNRGFVVADASNHRCVIFSPKGDVVKTFGTSGTDPGQFDYPIGVAIAPDGRIFVADSGNDRVQIFSSDGAYLGHFGSKGSGPGRLDGPADVAVVPNGRIYVTEYNDNRVSIFEDKSLKTRPTVKIRGNKNIRTKKGFVKLRGKAGAAPGTLLDNVYIKLPGRKPKAVKGADKWSFKLHIQGKSARAKIYSVDRLGQKSNVIRIKVRRKP